MRRYLTAIILILAIFCIGWGPVMLYVKPPGVAYLCAGTTDWGAGSEYESFEYSEGNFCCDDWTESDAAANISTYDATWAFHQTHSAEVNADNGVDSQIYGTTNSAVLNSGGSIYICTVLKMSENFDNGTRFSLALAAKNTANANFYLLQVTGITGNAANRIQTYGASRSSEYVDTQYTDDIGIELYVKDNAACWAKVWTNSGGGWSAETESGGDADGMIELNCANADETTAVRIVHGSYSESMAEDEYFWADYTTWGTSSCASRMGFE